MAPALTKRFTSKVEKTDGCWLWRSVISTGYGRFWVGGRGGRYVQAHRLSYEDANGPIPEGLTLDHLCRNRACVNPDHLEPVTMRENILRGVGFAAANAQKTACPRGHPFTSENTYSWHGHRNCRTCMDGRYIPREPKTHCAKGHEFTTANTYYRQDRGPANRNCRRCRADAGARHAERMSQ